MHKQNLVPRLQHSVDLSWDLHRKNPQTKGSGTLFRGKAACEGVRVCLIACAASKQTRSRRARPAMRVKLCGKDMTDVYGLS